MEFLITNLIYFGIAFILVLLIYILFINRKRKEYVEGKNQLEINYIINRFKLDMRKTKYKDIKWAVTFINAFIISFTFTVLINIEISYILKLLIGFVILFALIYSIYEIVGRTLKKKEEKN